jgi:hypothetical protein
MTIACYSEYDSPTQDVDDSAELLDDTDDEDDDI